MKRCICLLLAFFLLLSGCQTQTPAKSTSPGKSAGLSESTAPATTPSTTEAIMDIYQKSDPAQDEVLNILMIGNSGCYYYVEELYGMLEAAGMKANVCNVYYDGCRLSQHWSWWKAGEAKYDYFITNENGRVKTEKVDLEWCLQQQNWDVISLQEGGMAELRAVSTAEALREREIYLQDLYGYLREQFPMSRLYWQQSSAYQIGYNRKFQINSIEEQRQDTVIYRDFAIAVCEKFDVLRIPKGDAAMLVREAGYDNLCARLGKGSNNEGDYYHDGDWGGGQYLTACVWYEVLTGNPCSENPYLPEYEYQSTLYTLSDELVQLIRQCAHTAVEEMEK